MLSGRVHDGSPEKILIKCGLKKLVDCEIAFIITRSSGTSTRETQKTSNLVAFAGKLQEMERNFGNILWKD